MGSRNQISNNDKESDLLKADTICLLCNSRFHPTYRCSLTKLIRNKEIQVPLEFCPIHCGRVSESCKNGYCSTRRFKIRVTKLSILLEKIISPTFVIVTPTTNIYMS